MYCIVRQVTLLLIPLLKAYILILKNWWFAGMLNVVWVDSRGLLFKNHLQFTIKWQGWWGYVPCQCRGQYFQKNIDTYFRPEYLYVKSKAVRRLLFYTFLLSKTVKVCSMFTVLWYGGHRWSTSHKKSGRSTFWQMRMWFKLWKSEFPA